MLKVIAPDNRKYPVESEEANISLIGVNTACSGLPVLIP